MTSFVDPVSQPNEYQRLLLGRLGDNDPVEVQERTPAELRSLIEEAGADVRTRPDPKEWSVLELIAHICDAELVIAGRYRWILAHDTRHPAVRPGPVGGPLSRHLG